MWYVLNYNSKELSSSMLSHETDNFGSFKFLITRNEWHTLQHTTRGIKPSSDIHRQNESRYTTKKT